MIYKNNYQRKQAVWREKWRKKIEERQRKKTLYQPAIDAGVSLRKAFVGLGDALSEWAKIIRDGVSEIINDPEFVEKLREAQRGANDIGQGNG